VEGRGGEGKGKRTGWGSEAREGNWKWYPHFWGESWNARLHYDTQPNI